MEDNAILRLVQELFLEMDVKKATTACYFSGPMAECGFIGCAMRQDCIAAEITQGDRYLMPEDTGFDSAEPRSSQGLVAW